MRTIVYVDWFNFYYRIIENSGYHWIDLSKLLKSKLKQQHKIIAIKLFTANLVAIGNNQSAKDSQNIYHNALTNYIPNIEIFLGSFMKKTIRIPSRITALKIKRLEFDTFEEKETDVNLAIEMISDFHLNKFDCGVLVSNDTDFSGVLKKLRSLSNKPIGLITPGRQTRVSYKLSKYATFQKRITLRDIRNNQLPDRIPNSNIVKPPGW